MAPSRRDLSDGSRSPLISNSVPSSELSSAVRTTIVSDRPRRRHLREDGAVPRVAAALVTMAAATGDGGLDDRRSTRRRVRRHCAQTELRGDLTRERDADAPFGGGPPPASRPLARRRRATWAAIELCASRGARTIKTPGVGATIRSSRSTNSSRGAARVCSDRDGGGSRNREEGSGESQAFEP